MISRIKNIMSSSMSLIQTPVGKKISLCNVARDIVENRRIVYFGEIHSVPQIVQMQRAILEAMTDAAKAQSAKVHVFLEHFSIDDQKLLDSYMKNDITSEQDFLQQYENTSSEGHDIDKYFPILNYVKANNSTVSVKGSFIPRQYARMLVKEGENVAYSSAIDNNYLEEVDKHEGSESHYNFFESLISGRDLNSDQEVGENFRRIFPAQIIKDCAMASTVRRSLEAAAEEDKFLVIAGLGHLEYRFGVPERVDRHGLVAPDRTVIVSVRNTADFPHHETEAESIGRVDKFEQKYPGDYIYMYTDTEDEGEDVKHEISAAYDKVGSTARMEGNLELAKKVMKRLGYSPEQITVAGEDGYNYQGVGCPHGHAQIRPGEAVLDIGSGLGVDSFIAVAATGPGGSVTGLDISRREVEHATTRARDRGLDNVKFVNADMEKMPFEDNSFDVIVSNGAFCLAPNKETAFREIYRVLKPGGRFSVCCTTNKVDLDSSVEWPICMRVFMPLRDAEPLLNKIGFHSIQVDDSDSSMTLDDEDLQVTNESERYKIHGNTPEFQHLENFDMNNLCARVVLFGIKPN